MTKYDKYKYTQYISVTVNSPLTKLEIDFVQSRFLSESRDIQTYF